MSGPVSDKNFYDMYLAPITNRVDNSVNKNPDLGVGKHLGLRICNLAVGAIGAAVHAFDSAIAGIGAGFSAAFLGCSPRVNKAADNFFQSANNILPDAYATVAKFVNPRANSFSPMPTFSSKFPEKNFNKGVELAVSENVLDRHLWARLEFLKAGVGYVVTRVVDTVFGVFFALKSLVLLGTDKASNNRAYSFLNISSLPHDIYKTALRFFVPRADLGDNWFGLRSVNASVSKEIVVLAG